MGGVTQSSSPVQSLGQTCSMDYVKFVKKIAEWVKQLRLKFLNYFCKFVIIIIQTNVDYIAPVLCFWISGHMNALHLQFGPLAKSAMKTHIETNKNTWRLHLIPLDAITYITHISRTHSYFSVQFSSLRYNSSESIWVYVKIPHKNCQNICFIFHTDFDFYVVVVYDIILNFLIQESATF